MNMLYSKDLGFSALIVLTTAVALSLKAEPLTQMGDMLTPNTGASMLLYSTLKTLKKSAGAQELKDVKKEIRRAEKGALAYGVINLIMGLSHTNANVTQPIDAMVDASEFTGTYWVIRKAAQHFCKSSIGFIVKEALNWNTLPENFRATFKQVSLGLLTHILHQGAMALSS